MKFCSKCKVEKDESAFYIRRGEGTKDTIRNTCKECMNNSNKLYVTEHKEQVSNYKSKYYSSNKQSATEYSKNHYQSQRDAYINNANNWSRENESKRRIINNKGATKFRSKMSDGFIIKEINRNMAIPADVIKEYPLLIELKRLQILNKREIKKQLHDN